jgi:hypothetical protein
MKKNLLTSSIAILALVLMASPLLAAGPSVSKSVLAGENGTSVILIQVSAGSSAIYGVTLEDESGSIDDVIAPKGWCSIASDSKALFRTGDKPIQSGATLSLRIVTTNENASFGVIFKDSKTQIGGKKTI